jgi:serine protease Do
MKQMKKTLLAMTLLLGLGIAGAGGIAQDAPPKTAKVQYVKAPSAKLHKQLELNRVQVAAAVASYTVSVEIDYDRPDANDSPFRRVVQENDPFNAYDLGPFSGLVVGPHHVLISDRCLGDFNDKGASKAVEAITVTLPNGQRWPAKVVGRHQQIDLALLELDCVINETCPDMRVFELPSERVALERGEMVIVVGRGQNPLGTLVNDGIVSALERENGQAFQIDARIGNSTLGAPVVNRQGELVGIVTLHNHRTFGQASGVSYAAYLNEVREAYGALKQGQFLERPPSPFMGIGVSKKWPDKPGLEIGNVVEGSGAEKAGLRTGDVILKVNGEDMSEQEDLLNIISKHKVGDTLKVTILRNEEERTVQVTLGARP